MRLWTLSLAAALLAAGAAWADRVPSRKAAGSRVPGAKEDVRVAVTTNGLSNLGVYQGVARQILEEPVVDEEDIGVRRTFNLPFYGAVQGYSGRSNGAMTRPNDRPFPYPGVRR